MSRHTQLRPSQARFHFDDPQPDPSQAATGKSCKASAPAPNELAPDSRPEANLTGRATLVRQPPMLLTVRDLEAELQLGRTRTYELIRSGEIPVVRIGRAVRVPRDALRRWIADQLIGVVPSNPDGVNP